MKTVYKVYGISDCPACLRACALLMEEYPEKEYIFINCDFSKTFRNEVREKYNHPTFPLVVKIEDNSETLVGGFEDLVLSKQADVIYEAPPIRKST